MTLITYEVTLTDGTVHGSFAAKADTMWQAMRLAEERWQGVGTVRPLYAVPVPA